MSSVELRALCGPALHISHQNDAQVAELVDALVSGISGAIRGGSSPLLGTRSISGAVRSGRRPFQKTLVSRNICPLLVGAVR
jgi:hypothetical protein